MALDLQYFNDPWTFTVSTTDFNKPGSRGIVYETISSSGVYGGQLHKLVDAGGVAGDAVYYKSHVGSYEVTPTIGNSSTGELAGWLTATVAADGICFVQKKGVIVGGAKANGVFADGTPAWADSGNNRIIPAGVFSGSLSAAADTAGAILAVTNPCTGAWLVTSLIINRTTASTGAGTGDFGIAANATTLNDGLIDGLNLNATAASGENNFANAGTNGKASQYGAAGTVLTGSTASGAVAGMVGTYSGTFVPIGLTNSRLRVIGWGLGAVASGKVAFFADLPYASRQWNGV